MKRYVDYFQRCVYAFDGKDNIMEEKDLGICADIASMLTPEYSVSAMESQQGCPYTNTAFRFEVRLDGERVKCSGWKWLPNAMLRWGQSRELKMESITAVIPGTRTTVQKLTVTNLTAEALRIPLQVMYRGHSRKEELWRFAIPKAAKGDRNAYSSDGSILTYRGEGTDFALTASLSGMKLFQRAYLWENEVILLAGVPVTLYFSAHLGLPEVCAEEARQSLGRYEEQLELAFDWLEGEVARLERQLPRLSSDDPALDRLYYRSLVTYILCRWDNPDLCTVPYFSTGSINGACMCSYLWDYCGGLMLHPVYDSDCNKKQLLAYLRNDLTSSYALNPVTSGPVGPWYQINQEKIILMVYHHIRATGEKEFLFEKVGDKTVLAWMRFHAYVCDDTSRENELYDYGIGGNDHLELAAHGNGPYNGVIPDLNARRYLNYMRVYELTKLAGCPDENLPVRAAQLKEKLKTLWNEDARWYDFIDAEGNRDIRYTVQMFKFLNSPVIDRAQREGLISHLNEGEFLSKFGLHSMSKLDLQYDQDDIDNGGGGICTHFTMQICAQLYEMGYDTLATDILRRVYWWGERLPYMGDSCAANMIHNRETTPLQGDISSVSCAQMVFFYIFGITPHFDGSITVCPVKNRPATRMRIDNARLCGKVFSVEIDGDCFSVCTRSGSRSAAIGETVTI